MRNGVATRNGQKTVWNRVKKRLVFVWRNAKVQHGYRFIVEGVPIANTPQLTICTICIH